MEVKYRVALTDMAGTNEADILDGHFRFGVFSSVGCG